MVPAAAPRYTAPVMERVLFILALLAWLPPILQRWSGRDRLLLPNGLWLGLGVLMQIGALSAEAVDLGRVPLDSMRWGLALLSLWVVAAALYLRRQPRMDIVGSLLAGLAILLLGGAILAPDAGEADPFTSFWFLLHVALILLGVLGLALSFTLSVLFLWLRWRLKQRQLQGIARMPSLDTLDRLNAQTMALGFVALTAGMGVGYLSIAAHPEDRLVPDVTIYTTLAIWVWYAAGLHMRLVAGWRGRLAAIFGVVGFSALGFLVGLAMLMLNGWHGFGD